MMAMGVLTTTMSFMMMMMMMMMMVSEAAYLIGVGSYDITGPAADANMMGYADPTQNAAGIHFRLHARAFIVAEPSDGTRVAFVNLDACMASQVVTFEVLNRLKARYGGLYNERNVAISGTHTHSGPGGYLQYVLYIITSLGFIHQSFQALVDGIEKSIIQAHENLRPGSIFINKGELLDANINRSPSAYLNNPDEERAQYAYNTDKDMLLLKFVDAEWGPVGAFSWFAVHGTSMSRNNRLVSGDNKGAAARFMEDWYNSKLTSYLASGEALSVESVDSSGKKPHTLSSLADKKSYQEAAFSHRSTGGEPSTKVSSSMYRVRSSMLRETARPPFVAAFCQSNVGDTTPNVLGAFCVDTGKPCDFNTSTCNGKNELCIGHGPAYPDEFESTRIIAQRQHDKAVDLFERATEQIVGNIDFRHEYVDFSKLQVYLSSTKTPEQRQVVTTCPAAVGFGFAAGTTDGPGAFNFKQGDDQGNPFWKAVGSVLHSPSKEQVECQKPKPILIDTGEMFQPYAWAPAILPVQILRIGQLVILSVPAEMTTMSGRRLRDAVKKILVSKSNGEFTDSTHVVIAGLTNDYSQYVATFEEYQSQRYEGASTLYGPHTLSGYIQEFSKLASSMVDGTIIDTGPAPPNLYTKQIELLPPVVLDATPLKASFGDIVKDVPSNATFKRGDQVSTTFWSACPRNDLFTEGTFALIEMLNENGVWIPAYDDDDFCVHFMWNRPSNKLSPRSQATITWQIPKTTTSGTYRVRHFGASKNLLGSISHFTGASSAFIVI